MERFSPFGYVLLWEHLGYLQTGWGDVLLSARLGDGEVGAAFHPYGVRSTIGGGKRSEEWTLVLFDCYLVRRRALFIQNALGLCEESLFLRNALRFEQGL
ncbi:hypothetical protein [Paenibacillus lutimineralis]|uniref:Uncharacterized protein n=1 Tax=Paenibacillus lutimineralis TaxID=2707005 RepID=A0A3S9US07_9BACL|nr:hypothetical protein [Paenibacillus lutimineralis]AZS13071.1 hypothetical protein EI981_00200 [Paenibacillus lutimineralis]